MTKIVFDGWKEGFLKVSSAYLFQEYFSLNFREAKAKTDSLLDGKFSVLPVERRQEPERVVREFLKIGVLCHVE